MLYANIWEEYGKSSRFFFPLQMVGRKMHANEERRYAIAGEMEKKM